MMSILEVSLIFGLSDHISETIHEPNLVVWMLLMHMLGLEITVHYERPSILPAMTSYKEPMSNR